jgi:CPA1 family monovalent cation:H+ antiporter
MDLILASTVALLIIAITVALVARLLKLPYTVGLVVAGIALTTAQVEIGPLLTHDFIYLVILPPLLFEAAFSIRWNELRRDMVPVMVLSTVGVVISAAVVAGGMVALLGWPLPSALVFGVLIAATDPVAVIAMFKDIGLKGRLRLLVESESLFNDGVAAVLFMLVLAWAVHPQAGPPGILPAILTLVKISGGGIVIGMLVGALAILLARRTSDHLISAALTSASAYGSFLIAERFGCSGVLATVAAGLLLGNPGILGERAQKTFSAGEHEFILGLWDFAAFIANSLIFLLVGLTVARVPFDRLGFLSLFVAIGLVLLGRLLTVYPLCLAFRASRWAVALRDQHVLWWGGLRGALALALALALPSSLPFAGEIRIAAFGVVTFSVIVQGLTMPLLLRRLGCAPGRAG